ncbi:MAG TPA: D-ribose pyranase [Candidatus Nanopelagicaceae bacterium]|nr:D-ribose pyranase [Candidatus Nanopelagicaceae bacterium]
MKKTGILNRDVSALVASMGHYDRLVISDAGFPIPRGVPCIDLSQRPTVPTVLEIAELLAIELEVEQFYFAEEVMRSHPDRSTQVSEYFPDATGISVPHVEFKRLASDARGVIRTGDFTSYANVILVSGVAY